jgi:alpha-L-arabinofuranosidase
VRRRASRTWARLTLQAAEPDPKRLFLQTIYHPLRLYAERMLPIALDVHVAGEVYELSSAQEGASVGRIHHVADLGPFQLLDAAATCDDAGRRLALGVVNRDHDRDLTATVDLGEATAGPGEVWEVNGPDVAATNSFETPRSVDVRTRRVDVRASRFDYTFPAHSITLFELPIAR